MKKRVMDGEAFDVPLLLKPIDDALASGTVVETSLRSLAEVPIALAVKKGAPRPDISTPGALSGVLVDQMLDKMGISDQVLPKVQPRGGTAAVAKGDIDFTLAFQSE